MIRPPQRGWSNGALLRATNTMRHVDKGDAPAAEDGTPIVFTDYREAAPYLKERIGRYCSYCERTIPASLAVEHKLPKRYDHLVNEWRNLLLACSNCNSCKLDREVAVISPLWPDEEDTFAMTEYKLSGQIVAKEGLKADARDRVDALLELVGLDRTPTQLSNTDHRWLDRQEVWRKAMQSREDVQADASERLKRAIVETAKSSGGYSIWRTVFDDDADMTQRLIDAFPGTRSLTTPI